MVRFCFLMVWAISTFAGPQPTGQSEKRTNRLPSYKKMQIEGLTLMFSGLTVHEARTILEYSKLFMTELQKTWQVRLENMEIELALNVDHQKPYESGYKLKQKYGFLQIQRFDMEFLKADVGRVLILAMLNQRETALPLFIQEGIASYFGGRTPGDKDISAAFALWKHPQVPGFLKQDESLASDSDSFDLLSYIFIEKLWDQNRASFVTCLQHLLQGKNMDSAISLSGLGTLDNLLEDFRFWIESKYSLSRIAYFPGFWKILAVFVLMCFFLWNFYRAWRVSGFPTQVLGSQSEKRKTDAPEFQGPAFGGRTFADLHESDYLDSPEIIDTKPLSKVLFVHPTGMENDQTLGQDSGHKKIEPTIVDESLEEAVQAIEQDIDEFFESAGLDPKLKAEAKAELKPKAKPKSKALEGEFDEFKDLDDHIDGILDI